MKNNKLIFVLIWLFVISCFAVISPRDITFSKSKIGVSLDKESIEKNETVEMTIDTQDPEIRAGTLEIYFDTAKLEYMNKTENSNFVENRIIYTWIDENLKEKSIPKTEKFQFKAIGEGTANIIVTGSFYDKDGKEIQLEDGAVQVTIGQEKNVIITDDIDGTTSEGIVSKSNVNLKVLRLDKEGISPEFQKNVREYYFIADDTTNSLQITAIPENEKSQVSVIGNTNLKQGKNTIKIQVESEDKTKKSEYKIYVTKTKNKELANANLENLAIKEGWLYPAFDANITEYDIEVANDISNLTILVIPEKLKAKTSISGGSNLKIGDNTIVVKVTAEDGITIKKYVITAHRRSEVEEIKAEEEQNEQVEQLSSILENNLENEEEQNKVNTQEDEKNRENKKENIYVKISVIVMVILIVGGGLFVYFRKKKTKF